MATSRESGPDFVRWLVEPQTLRAAGCERTVEWRLPDAIWQVPEADAVRALVESPPPGRRAALAMALGYEFDPRRLRFEELGRRITMAELLHRAGQDRLIFSPVLYQSRPRWDIYAPRLRALAIVNHLAGEKDVLGHLQHSNLNFVLWAPDPSERANPTEWYCLRYTALNPPDSTARNWFDETVRQAEHESLTRRRLTLELKNGEKDLPAIQSTLDAYRAAVRGALDAQLVE